MRSTRIGAVVLTAAALVAGVLGTAVPASALSPVTYTSITPTDAWVGSDVGLGLDCGGATCPVGVTNATVAIEGGPTLDLPASPDYQLDWFVDGVVSYADPQDNPRTVTVSFTDETGSPRTLTSTMVIHKDSPNYVENPTPHDGMSATVSWDPPVSDGGSPITNYLVQIDDDPWATLSAAARSISLEGYPYGPHEVRVIATNAIGWGWGDRVTVLRGVMPSAPAVTVTGTTSPSVSWTAVTGGGIAVTGYTVYTDGVPVRSVSAATLSTTLPGLEPGTQDITVAADTAIGAGDMSVPVTWDQPSRPSAVSTPTVTPGNAKLSVSWSPPSADGGLPVTAYQVRAIDPFTRTVMSSLTTSATSGTLTGLVNTMPVLVQVAAVNAMGASVWTDAAAAVAPVGATPASASVSIGAGDTTPTSAQPVHLSGMLSIAGKSETGQKVQIWGRVAGSTTWTRLAIVSASSTGAWSWWHTFTRTTAVQARYLGSASLPAKPANSSTPTLTVRLAVSARTTTTGGTATSRISLGGTIAVPTSVAAAPTGAKATLQRRVGSSWVNVASVSVVSGKARPLWKPGARGTYYLRVYVSGSSSVGAGTSSVLTLAVV